MNRIEAADKLRRSIERGDPQPTCAIPLSAAPARDYDSATPSAAHRDTESPRPMLAAAAPIEGTDEAWDNRELGADERYAVPVSDTPEWEAETMNKDIGATLPVPADTPRTDIKEREQSLATTDDKAFYGWKFARQLERELAEAKAEIDRQVQMLWAGDITWRGVKK